MRKSTMGWAIIAIYFLFALITPLLINKDAITNWNSRLYWRDYPTLAPPEWVNAFGANLPTTENISAHEIGKNIYVLKYSFKYSTFPQNIKIKFNSKPEGNIVVNMTAPDGTTYTLYRGRAVELNFGRDTSLIKTFTEGMGIKLDLNQVATAGVSSDGVKFLLGKKKGTSWEPVSGEYVFTIRSSSRPYLWITGKVYGIMGTDTFGRDIWQAFLAGTRSTLLIVFTTSFTTVGLGVLLGLLGNVSSLVGKMVDGISQISGMLPSIPLLVALIPPVSTVSYYGNLEIPVWAFVLTLSLLLFGKIAQNVKTIVKVEMSKEYVLSSRSLGASDLWILKKHISKSVMPYAFSQFILISAKTVALLSLLGFFSVVPGMNWGSLMAMVVTQRAFYYRAWWMVIPVGAVISLLAMAFILINMDIEERRESFMQ